MKSKGNVLFLSEEGLLHVDKEAYANIPFQHVAVIAGDVHEDQVAVIVDKHEVWTFVSEEWRQLVSTDITLNCICWTSDTQLLVGTESARLAWIANGSLTFIDSFDTIPERQHWMTPCGGPPDVRSLAISQDGTLYADIHVGWIVRSRDGGKRGRTFVMDWR